MTLIFFSKSWCFFSHNESQGKISNRNSWQIPNNVKLLPFHPKDLLSGKTTSWNLSILPIKLNSFLEEKDTTFFLEHNRRNSTQELHCHNFLMHFWYSSGMFNELGDFCTTFLQIKHAMWKILFCYLKTGNN